MHFLRCRTCGLRISIPKGTQFEAAGIAERKGWVIEWQQSPGFPQPFLRLWCSTYCWKAGAAITVDAFESLRNE